MRFRPNQKTTHLGTKRKFNIVPMKDAPEGFQQAFLTTVYLNLSAVVFVIRSDAHSGQWRIDRNTIYNLWEAFPKLSGLYETPELAAQALVARFPL